jgi:hypothetical protein
MASGPSRSVCPCLRRICLRTGAHPPLHRIASHRIASHRIASHRIASHRIASHRIWAATDPRHTWRIFEGAHHSERKARQL